MGLMRSSTRRFVQESMAHTHSLLNTLHGYVYLRWPVLYIGTLLGTTRTGKVVSRCLGWFQALWPQGFAHSKDDFAHGYHGKVMPVGTVRQLIDIQRPVQVSFPEQVLPYRHARDLILAEGDAVALLDCPCRLARETHCTPVDVCILLGKTVVEFALEHYPDRVRRVTPDEAVEVVRRCNEAGNVTHAFFKKAVLDRFYAICNCCSCCCGAMTAHRNGMPMLASSGYLARVEDTSCVHCGQCAARCPFEAITVTQETTTIKDDACMGCGVCTLACARHALHLERAPERGTPLELAG